MMVHSVTDYSVAGLFLLVEMKMKTPRHDREGSSTRAEASSQDDRRFPGVRDVALSAGVSTATVSRFLNEPTSVRPDIRLRVESAVRELGYIRHGAARALSMRRSHAIGAIIPTVDNATRAGKVAALQKRCRERGYNVLLALFEYDLELELAQCRNLIEAGVDGLMLEGELHHPALYQLMEKRGIPFVNTAIYDPRSPHPNIGFDNQAAAARLTEHLLDLGHRIFAMIGGPSQVSDRASGRIKGLRQALAARGLDLPADRTIEGSYRVQQGRQGLRTLMSGKTRPTAVVCGNDVLAFGALLEAQALGLRVPQDLSIAGFDDLDWASQLPPGLTTMALPAREVGQLAADHLVDRLAGQTVPHATEVEVRLILRGSTGPAPEG
jgi:LacI family transcriptional regulator